MRKTASPSPVICPAYAYISGANSALRQAFIHLVTLTVPMENGQDWEFGVILVNDAEHRYRTAIYDGLGYHTGPDVLAADIADPATREAALDVIDAIYGQNLWLADQAKHHVSAARGPN